MTGRILYVEDNDFFSQVVSDALQKKGHSVTIAKNGEEGLAFLQKGKFDLVFLDILMPKMDGFELLKAAREHLDPKVAPVVAVLSNISSEHDMQQAKELGASAFLIKASTSPDDITTLADKLLSKGAV